MNKNSQKINLKNLYFKNKNIVLLVGMLIILFFLVFIFIVKTKKSTYDNSGYSSLTEKDQNSFTNYLVFSQPFPNSTPVFELSQDSSDKKNIWSFVKNNFKLNSDSTTHEDMVGNLPFIVKNNQSNYQFNISGFYVDIDEIQDDQERLSTLKKIEQEIVSLGYKLVPANFKNSVFQIVNEYSLGTDFYVKDNQVFSLFYNKDECYGQWGGCGILVIYSNNIDKQIKSQQTIFNKLNSSINTYPTLKELITNKSYFTNTYNSIAIDKYKIFLIGHYDSDSWTILTEEQKNGSLKIIAIDPSDNKNEYDELTIEKLPNEILCALKSMSYDGFGDEVTKKCSKYLKPYYSGIY